MSAKKSILVVDDDEALLLLCVSQIDKKTGDLLFPRQSWNEATQAGCGAEALAATKTENFDLMLLDVGLPDTDGRELCKVMRRNGIKVPIIMLTAADGDADTILGLDSGGNDYMSKPFRLAAGAYSSPAPSARAK